MPYQADLLKGPNGHVNNAFSVSVRPVQDANAVLSLSFQFVYLFKQNTQNS